MIATLAGRVAQVGLDRIVIEVGGLGLLVHTTPATASAQRRGQDALVWTSLVVREDSLTLFGFAGNDEREMFETLQTVSGVGPRLALAMLSVMGPEELRVALSTGDTKALTRIPGIGAKSAERLVLELRDKMGPASAATPGAAASGQAPAASWREQVGEALVGLGWSAKQAAEAVEKVAATAPADTDIPTYLRLALRELRR